MILRDTVKVTRIVTTGKSPTGTPTTAISTIYASLKCDLQPDQGVVIVPIQGQTTIYYKNMFCNIADIKANDIVTNLSTNEAMKVININSYGLLKHMEIRLQGGVL